MNLPIEITEVMVIIVGLGVIIGLVVSLLIKDDGVVVIAITLAILLVIFLILEILFHPVSKVLYQFLPPQSRPSTSFVNRSAINGAENLKSITVFLFPSWPCPNDAGPSGANSFF